MQKIYVSGRIGSVSELKELGEGVKVLRFTVAVNERFKQKSGDYTTKTLWTAVSLWGSNAAYWSERLSKGAFVGVWGKLEYDDSGHPKIYTNKDNVCVSEFVIRADSFGVELFTPQKNTADKPEIEETLDEDIPF